jgi:hypothetical protein
MRFEATLSETRGRTLNAVAEELGMSRSQLMDEALALWLEVIEARKRGARLVVQDPAAEPSQRELVTPAMAHLDWWHHRVERAWSAEELRSLAAALEEEAAPTEALRQLMAGEHVEGGDSLEMEGIG